MTPTSRFTVAALAALALLPGVAAAATWGPVSHGVINGSASVYSLAVDPAGGVFAGGNFEDPCTGPVQLQTSPPSCPFTYVFPPPYTGIGHWAASGWTTMGVGLGGSAPFGADVQVGPDGRTYVAGPFNDAGQGTSNYLAVWNGITWSSLGTGFLPVSSANPPGRLNALSFGSAGDLYVAGSFTSVNGVTAANVARWNGTSWSPLGAGPYPADPSEPVMSLAVTPDGTLYAGGNFYNGNPGESGLAIWNGTSWSSAPAAFDTGVYELAADRQGNVYAGGHFNAPTRGLARWDGTSWSALGSGLDANADVSAIAIDHDGGVYVAGTRMLPASGAPNVVQVAKWDGTTWTLLAASVTTPVTGAVAVNDLAIDPAGYLYAAGSFLVIDGQTTGQMARTVIATPPGAPTGVSATAGDTTAEVSWTAPTRNGAGTITGYAVTSEPDGRTCTWSSGPLRCTVTGLRKGTRYAFTVRAVNMAGAGAAASAEASTSADAASPTASTTPRIARLVPAKGPVRGGNRVQVRGSDLADATRVTFGGVRARIIRRTTDRLVVVAPAHARGRVAVTVTAGTARDTKRRAYRYVAPVPRKVPAVTG